MSADAKPRSRSYKGFTSTSASATARMRRNTRAGGAAEKLLRSEIWRIGLRYRVQPRDLVGTPDVVFSSQRVCVFCDGDFWHGRDWPVLRRQLEKRANPLYWVPKIRSNRVRDRRVTRSLERRGWTVLRYWETDVLGDAGAIAEQIARIVRRRKG